MRLAVLIKSKFFLLTNQNRVLCILLMCKALHKSNQYIRSFELLQREFQASPTYTSLLFVYGKYVVKAMSSEIKRVEREKRMDNRSTIMRGMVKGDFSLDQGYLGSGIGALEECCRSCLFERHANVNLIIGQAYKILKMPLKCYEYWRTA